MTDNLDAFSDHLLCEAFALEVAQFESGWSGTGMSMNHDGYRWLEGDEWKFCYASQLPRFATDANAVLPYLENYDWAACGNEAGNTVIVGPNKAEGMAPTFARAACIALIRAKRAQKS